MNKGLSTLSEAFHDYLMERFGGDEPEVSQTIEIAETIIPGILTEHFGANYGSIYELQDANDIDDFSRR